MKKIIIFCSLLIVLLYISTPAYADTIFITPSEKTIEEGKSFNLYINYFNDALDYQSTNEEIATVSETGEITAISPGEVKILVTLYGQPLVCNVTVIKKKDLQISDNNIVLFDKQTLYITTENRNINETQITYEIENKDVIKLDVKNVKDNKIPIVISKSKLGDTKITITAKYSDGTIETQTLKVFVIKELYNIYFSTFM